MFAALCFYKRYRLSIFAEEHVLYPQYLKLKGDIYVLDTFIKRFRTCFLIVVGVEVCICIVSFVLIILFLPFTFMVAISSGPPVITNFLYSVTHIKQGPLYGFVFEALRAFAFAVPISIMSADDDIKVRLINPTAAHAPTQYDKANVKYIKPKPTPTAPTVPSVKKTEIKNDDAGPNIFY